MSIEKRIRAYLDLVHEDPQAAEVLARAGNRYAAYHCQQAVEKLVKALLLHTGTEAGIEHRLDVLISRLGETDPWREALRPLDKYTPFATTFRYPTPGGRIAAAPPPADVLADVAILRGLLDRAKAELLAVR
jgi:HEPN domain-containing protein